MLPVIALVGRPNVGKSTLFNRLTRSRDALVADYEGLTRDRKYGEAIVDELRFIVIDTGGLSGLEEGIDGAMAQQSLAAIEEADEVVLLVDAKAGLMPADEAIAKEIRQRGKPFSLVANKIDGMDETTAGEFYALGVDRVFPVTATHGRGVKQLVDSLAERFPEYEHSINLAKSKSTRIAIVGRPNVGKSTLVNRMLGEDRGGRRGENPFRQVRNCETVPPVVPSADVYASSPSDRSVKPLPRQTTHLCKIHISSKVSRPIHTVQHTFQLVHAEP